jgi:hypothetical protein
MYDSLTSKTNTSVSSVDILFILKRARPEMHLFPSQCTFPAVTHAEHLQFQIMH